MTEEVEVRLLQLDITVQPPNDPDFVMPELTLDHFDIRIDFEKLDEETRKRTRLDSFCSVEQAGQAQEEDSIFAPQELGAQSTPDHPVIVFFDHNYLDNAARARVADAIDALVADPSRAGEIYKFYDYNREVTLAHRDFTRDPNIIRQVATQVRNTATFDRRTDVFDNFVNPTTGAEQLNSDSLIQNPSLSGNNVDTEENIQRDASDDFQDDAEKDHDPRSSLAAIEGVLRANRHIPGRKSVILFTSGQFGNMSQFDEFTRAVSEVIGVARQSRYNIYSVDATGLNVSVGQVGDTFSGLDALAALSQDTGGATVRRTMNLAKGFESARESLSCYYLVSVPVSKSKSRSKDYNVDIRFDTDKYPDLWEARVLAPKKITLLGTKERVESDLQGALLSPDDFHGIPVQAAVGFATREGRRERKMPIRLRVPLNQLSFIPRAGAWEANIVINAVVERLGYSTGREVCDFGNAVDQPLALKLGSEPAEDSQQGIIFEFDCSVKKDAGYRSRVAVVDLNSGRVGAATGKLLVWNKAEKEELRAVDLHIETASKGDLYWKDGQIVVGGRTDDEGDATLPWVTVENDTEIDTAQAVAARYTLCGPDAKVAPTQVVHYLLEVEDGQLNRRGGLIDGEMAFLSLSEDEGPFCAAVSVGLPSLEGSPGDYLLVVGEADKIKPSSVQSWLKGDAEGAVGLLGAVKIRARELSPFKPNQLMDLTDS